MTTFDLENPTPNAGDRLRDEAANLLSSKYGRVYKEQREKGKKADLYFKRDDFGKEVRIFVEAKDYQKPLTRRQVALIWSDYSGIIDKNKPSKLLVITKMGLTADAQAFVQDEQSDMRHQTIWELENEILGLTDYIRSLTGLFENNLLSSYYIPGRTRLASYSEETEKREYVGSDLDIFEEVKLWIDNGDYTPMAVLGGYGAGKTSLARRIISHQAQEALSNPLARRPVLISLGVFVRYSDLAGLLGGMFTHDFPVNGFNSHHFLEQNEKGKLLIVLDGFDEMKHAMSWNDFRSQLSALNALIKGKSKVILLGRPSAFVSTDEHFHVLRGMKRVGSAWWDMPDWPRFYEHDLLPFSSSERADFVRKYLLAHTEKLPANDDKERWVKNRAEEVNRLADAEAEVFGKPVHAEILTKLASDPAVDLHQFSNGVSRWALYEIFFDSLVEREADKEARRPIKNADRLAFLREVSFWLWSEKGSVTSFSAHDIPEEILKHLANGGAADLDSLKREYLSGSSLEKKSGDVYYFGHRSFAEFLVAKRMLQHPPESRDHSIYSKLVKDGVYLFLKEAPEKDFGSLIKWPETLDKMSGEIHLEYLDFLSEICGGIGELHQRLPEHSIWRPIVKVFNKNSKIELTKEARDEIVNAMRTTYENDVFFILLDMLLREGGNHKTDNTEFYITSIAAALLERVFDNAVMDSTTFHVSIKNKRHPALILASSVMPDIDGGYSQHITFLGKRLLDKKARMLDENGVGIALHNPSAIRNIAEEVSLPLDSVLLKMSANSADVAREYFKRHNSFRNIYAVDRSRNRSRKKK